MKCKAVLLAAGLFIALLSFAQTDTAGSKALPPVFEKIMKEVGSYRPDTAAPPADKITQKIIELRNLRGGFNVNEAIAFKLEEDRQKGELTTDAQKRAAAFFTTGDGRRWLDNAVIWIYRAHFTYNELKGLVKFYKTSAGQKLASDFPVVMLESMVAGQMLKEAFDKSEKKL